MLKIIRNKSIKYKLSFGYIISMFFSIIIAVSVYATIVNSTTEHKMYENDLSSANIFYNFILQEITGVKLTSNSIVTSQQVQRRLNNENSEGYIEELNKILYSFDSIKSIYIIDKNFKIEAFNDRANYDVYYEDFINKINFEELDGLRGSIKYSLEVDRYMNSNDGIIDISLSRAILSNETLEVIGYLIIYLNDDYMNKIYETCINTNNIQYILENKEGNKIFFPKNSSLRDYVQDIFELEHTDRYNDFKINQESYNVVFKNADIVEGKLVMITSEVSSTNEVIILIIILIIINIIFSGMYFHMLDLWVVDPINKIINRIDTSMGESGINKKYDYGEEGIEIAKIGISLNNLMDKIEKLVNEIHCDNEQKRKLELEVLNNNVKPHFYLIHLMLQER